MNYNKSNNVSWIASLIFFIFCFLSAYSITTKTIKYVEKRNTVSKFNDNMQELLSYSVDNDSEDTLYNNLITSEREFVQKMNTYLNTPLYDNSTRSLQDLLVSTDIYRQAYQDTNIALTRLLYSITNVVKSLSMENPDSFSSDKKELLLDIITDFIEVVSYHMDYTENCVNPALERTIQNLRYLLKSKIFNMEATKNAMKPVAEIKEDKRFYNTYNTLISLCIKVNKISSTKKVFASTENVEKMVN